MVKITSQSLVAGLGLLIALSFATPAEAQKTRSGAKVSRGTTVRVSGGSSARSGGKMRSGGASRARGSSGNRSSGARSSRSSGKVVRYSGSRVRSGNARSSSSGKLSRGSVARGQNRNRGSQGSSNVVRYGSKRQGPSRTTSSRTSSKLGDRTVMRRGSTARGNAGEVARVGGSNGGGDGSFRNRRELERNNVGHGRRGHRDGVVGRSGRGHGYGLGYGRNHGRGYGYSFGFHLGYHRGYSCGGYYSHRCFYGNLGYYYGGFGFFGPYWNFVLVLGAPASYYGAYPYHYYTWRNNGRRTRLYGWEETAYRTSDYRFDEGGACVALRVKTTDGDSYDIQIDPTQYNASDPGDLYALLWAELEEKGELYLEDINGSIHSFPASAVREIEAGACSY